MPGEDWLDCFLAAGEMSTTWRACGKMLEFFVEKEGISFYFPLFPLFFYMKISVSYVRSGALAKPALFLVFTRCG